VTLIPEATDAAGIAEMVSPDRLVKMLWRLEFNAAPVGSTEDVTVTSPPPPPPPLHPDSQVMGTGLSAVFVMLT
jgi:hypothetical protein